MVAKVVAPASSSRRRVVPAAAKPKKSASFRSMNRVVLASSGAGMKSQARQAYSPRRRRPAMLAMRRR